MAKYLGLPFSSEFTSSSSLSQGHACHYLVKPSRANPSPEFWAEELTELEYRLGKMRVRILNMTWRHGYLIGLTKSEIMGFQKLNLLKHTSIECFSFSFLSVLMR